MSGERFLVWHTGPDDITPARTWIGAAQLAQALNDQQIWYELDAAKRGVPEEARTRSWATPFSVEEYVRQTGHQISFEEEQGR